MTAQRPEHLVFVGKDYKLCSEPLESYLRGMQSRPMMRATNSACWRGYLGNWEILDGKLYLTSLTIGNRYWCADMSPEEQELWEAMSEQDDEHVSLETLFPKQELPIFAGWFTGTLRCASGAVVNYVHGGYESTYENELFIDIENGCVITQSGGGEQNSIRL